MTGAEQDVFPSELFSQKMGQDPDSQTHLLGSSRLYLTWPWAGEAQAPHHLLWALASWLEKVALAAAAGPGEPPASAPSPLPSLQTKEGQKGALRPAQTLNQLNMHIISSHPPTFFTPSSPKAE